MKTNVEKITIIDKITIVVKTIVDKLTIVAESASSVFMVELFDRLVFFQTYLVKLSGSCRSGKWKGSRRKFCPVNYIGITSDVSIVSKVGRENSDFSSLDGSGGPGANHVHS